MHEDDFDPELFEDAGWTRINNSKPPLRWIANTLGSIASSALLRISYAQEQEKENSLKYKIDCFIWDKFWPIYDKYGTFYKMNYKDKF